MHNCGVTTVGGITWGGGGMDIKSFTNWRGPEGWAEGVIHSEKLENPVQNSPVQN